MRQDISIPINPNVRTIAEREIVIVDVNWFDFVGIINEIKVNNVETTMDMRGERANFCFVSPKS